MSATKKSSFVRLVIPAGKATPTPPVGPALGQRGVKAIDFCKQFNEATKMWAQSIPIPTKITVNPDRTFKFVTKTPPTAWLLKKAAQVEKGAKLPGSEVAATISVKHIYEIGLIKQNDPSFQGKTLEGICKRILGQTRSMGIKVVN